MSPLPDVKVKESPAIPVKQEPPVIPVKQEETPQRITILSELDSYILERQKEQPASLEDAVSRIEVQDARPRHRMEMPDSLQKYFWNAEKNPSGRFIPRWVLKDKRAIDNALVKGWLFFNRSYFPDAPRYLFTANGAIEVGDTILAFMPVKQALAIRYAPAKLSQERLRGQMTQVKPDYVLMSGNKNAEHVYQPELGPEESETSEEKVPGVLTADRDF